MQSIGQNVKKLVQVIGPNINELLWVNSCGPLLVHILKSMLWAAGQQAVYNNIIDGVDFSKHSL